MFLVTSADGALRLVCLFAAGEGGEAVRGVGLDDQRGGLGRGGRGVRALRCAMLATGMVGRAALPATGSVICVLWSWY